MMMVKKTVPRRKQESRRTVKNPGLNDGLYLARTIKEHPVLTKQQELDLFRAISISTNEEEKRKLREKAVLHNLGLCFFTARRYFPFVVDLQDIVQAGIVGLVKAVDYFKFEKGNKFSTYAIKSIRTAIARHLGLHIKGRYLLNIGMRSLDEFLRTGASNGDVGYTRKDSIRSGTSSPVSISQALQALDEAQTKLSRMLGYVEILPIPSRDRQIFKSYSCPWISDIKRTMVSVGIDFEVSKERVRQINDSVWMSIGILDDDSCAVEVGRIKKTYQRIFESIEEIRCLLGIEDPEFSIKPAVFLYEEKVRLLAKL